MASDGSVEVAVVAVKVVEGPVDEVVDVVAVGHGRVPASGGVLRRALHGRTGGGPAPVHVEDVLRDARAAG
jgi:hypothetical protein